MFLILLWCNGSSLAGAMCPFVHVMEIVNVIVNSVTSGLQSGVVQPVGGVGALGGRRTP